MLACQFVENFMFALNSRLNLELLVEHSVTEINVTDLDLVTSLLSHLLKFKVFQLTESFSVFSYFDTSCFDT